MKGYCKKPEETAAVLKDGWLFTGDIGFLDEDGYLTILDRKEDLIVADGRTIYPSEIDEALLTHPEVLEACTIGVPDENHGETVKAYVVLKPGETAEAEEIIAHCRETLAPDKVPQSIEFIDALPKSAVGKILRRELKENSTGRSGWKGCGMTRCRAASTRRAPRGACPALGREHDGRADRIRHPPAHVLALPAGTGRAGDHHARHGGRSLARR